MTKAPYILICGGAGSGKDTLGAMLAHALDGVCVAQADPMKQLAKLVFEFTDDQLWGPSESRNAPDPRYDTADAWNAAASRLEQHGTPWLSTVLPDWKPPAHVVSYFDSKTMLANWFRDLARAHGFEEAMIDWSNATGGTGGTSVGWSVGPNFPQFRAFSGASKRQLTARYMLQTVGTEFGRKVNPRMWNDYSLTQGELLLAGGHSYDREHGAVADTNRVALSVARGPKPYGVAIITDGRFPNEAVGVKQRGGLLINVLNPDSDNASVEKAGVAGHVSEKGIALIPRHWYDAMVVNDKANGLLALAKVVETIVNRIQRGVDLFATATPTDVMHSC